MGMFGNFHHPPAFPLDVGFPHWVGCGNPLLDGENDETKGRTKLFPWGTGGCQTWLKTCFPLRDGKLDGFQACPIGKVSYSLKNVKPEKKRC